MGIYILGIDIMGVDILGVDIPAPTHLTTTQVHIFVYWYTPSMFGLIIFNCIKYIIFFHDLSRILLIFMNMQIRKYSYTSMT